MKNNILYLFFVASAILLSACDNTSLNHSSGRYYAPTIFVNGQEMETMLTTDFASFDIIPQGDGTMNVSLQYQGPNVGGDGIYYIKSFRVNLSGISCDNKESCATLSGEEIEAELFYDYIDRREDDGKGSIIRTFKIEGTVSKTDRDLSNITISSVIFDKPISFSLAGMTPTESEAEFGVQGYPGINANLVYSRHFVNNTNHSVEIRYIGSPGSDSGPLALSSGGEGSIMLLEEGGYYSLTFDDGRTSVHMSDNIPFHYEGLPVDVKERPYLFFNWGRIFYDIYYNCTYTITQEVYEAAE